MALAFHAMRLYASPGAWSRSWRSSLSCPARFARRPSSAARRARPRRRELATIASSRRGGQHLDAERIREEERHFVERLAAERGPAHLEREAVNPPAADPPRHDRHLDARARPRRQVERVRGDRRFEHTRGERAQPHDAHGRHAAVEQLSLEHDGAVARRAAHARRSAPDHLEARCAQARDADERHGPADGDGQEHRAAEAHDGREPRGGAESDEACAGDGHVERRPRGVELHALAPVRRRAYRGGS